MRHPSLNKVLAHALVLVAIAAACDRPTEPQFRSPTYGHSDVVPAVAPDEFPATLDDATQWITSDSSAVLLHRSVLIVRFLTTATQAQRQAAIDSVSGTVIGGRPSGVGPDGFYYVWIPTDSTAAAVYAAADKLSALPQTRLAIPYYLMTTDALAYRRPHDLGDWANWKLKPSQTGSEKNWSAELLNLPYAWGCSVGDTATHVAVIDLGFHDVVDDSANVRTVNRKNVIATIASDASTYHGDGVTEILAATGDDSIGMTGAAWRASIHQFDAGVIDSSTGGYKQIDGQPTLSQNAISTYVQLAVTLYHARVINLSQGSPYLPGYHLTAEDVRQQSAAARFLYVTLRDLDTLRQADPTMRTPLVVIAAGNNGQLASASGWAQNGAGDLSDRVIVVTASSNSLDAVSSLPSFANFGPEVTVAAPGNGIWVRPNNGSDQQFNGTSFAAPAIAGIATLLFSFDPSLTAQDARLLILQGASSSGRAVEHAGILYPVADAYASLKFAAERAHAPLCGNQVWAANGSMYVGRTATGPAELLGTTGGAARYVDVYHGGKWIDYDTDLGDGHFKFTPSGWTSTPDWNPSDDWPSGAYWSGSGYDHDGEASIRTSIEIGNGFPVSPDSERITVFVQDTAGNEDSTMVEFSSGTSAQWQQTWGTPLAYPPVGDTALVAVPRWKGNVNDLTYSCLDDRGVPATCHQRTIVWSPDRTYLYSVRVRGGSPVLHLIREMPDTAVYWMSLSEDAHATALAVGSEVDTIDVDNGLQGSGFLFCSVQYRDAQLGGSPQRSIASTDGCPDLSYTAGVGGAGGFSASRGGSGFIPMRSSSLTPTSRNRLRSGWAKKESGWRERMVAETIRRAHRPK